VHKAHGFAAQALIDLIMGEHQLLGKLRSIKHYMLLDQGDFFVHFMDVAEEELTKKASHLQVLFQLIELYWCVRVSQCCSSFIFTHGIVARQIRMHHMSTS
jgi:Gamma tubulin complex component C-terminal